VSAHVALATLHLLGVALLFGSSAMLDLRLLGVSRSIPVRTLARHVLPWTAASFLLIIPTGAALFARHAAEFLASPVFAIKMGLVMAALLNAGLFHAITLRTADVWDSQEMRNLGPPPSARLAGALSLALWAAVIACGRILAERLP
jgi:hypothetical protein